jgi:hypothetical protein
MAFSHSAWRLEVELDVSSLELPRQILTIDRLYRNMDLEL